MDSISDFTLRKIITKFRCSDHCLEIEKGRHIKLKPEERICKLCKSDVETELHFIQDCPAYIVTFGHIFWEIIPRKESAFKFSYKGLLTQSEITCCTREINL